MTSTEQKTKTDRMQQIIQTHLSRFDFCAPNLTQEGLSTLKSYLHAPVGFLTLVGPNGTGKTGSAKIFLDCWCTRPKEVYKNEWGMEYTTGGCLDTDHGQMINIPFFYQKWKRNEAEDGDNFYILEELIRLRVLILDDLGLRAPSPSFLEYIHTLIDQRWYQENQTLTIITTNKTSEELALMFGDAFISRISSGKVVKFEGKDMRKNW